MFLNATEPSSNMNPTITCSLCGLKSVEKHKSNATTEPYQHLIQELSKHVPSRRIPVKSEPVCRRCEIYLRELQLTKSEKARENIIRRMKDKPTTSNTGIVTEKPNPPKKASKSHDSLLEDFENHLSWAERLAFVKELPTHLTCEEKASLSNSIARSERQTIWQEAAVISTQSNCHDGVKKFNSNERAEWVSQRNKTLLAFVIGLTGLQYPCSGAFPQMIILCMVLEHLYHMTYPRLLAPNSFLFSLFLYNKTGSWSAVDMLGKILPSGSYKTITGFLRCVAPDKPFVPKDGVIMNTFDNQQVLT